MTANGAHGGGDAGPPIAGDVSTFPSDAELSRTLVTASKTASLSTLTNSGYPYGSIVSYVPDDNGGPVILVSDLAEHTINARSNNRASMLIAESADGDDPLGSHALHSLAGFRFSRTPQKPEKRTCRNTDTHRSMLILMISIFGNYPSKKSALSEVSAI